MRIEQTPPSVTPRDAELLPLRPLITDTITSPYAPVWPTALVSLFSWLYQCIRPILFFLPKEKAPSPPQIERAIYKVEKEHQKPHRLTTAASNALIPALISWWQKDGTVLAMYAAKTGLDVTASSIEKLAHSTLPNGFPHLKKSLGLIAGAPIIWHLADHLGYPQGKVYLFSVSIGVLSIFAQAQAKAHQNDQKRLKIALAG